MSPSVLYSSDLVPRPLGSSHLQQGFVILSALQVRGHAMFSAAGRALDEETLEYSWIIEAILGQLTGRLTLPQLEQIIAGLEAFIHLALDDENQLSRPKSQTPCHHGASQLACSYSAPNLSEAHCLGSVCPTAEEIKYKMTRVSVDLIDITMVETGTALGLQVTNRSNQFLFKKIFFFFLNFYQIVHFVIVVVTLSCFDKSVVSGADGHLQPAQPSDTHRIVDSSAHHQLASVPGDVSRLDDGPLVRGTQQFRPLQIRAGREDQQQRQYMEPHQRQRPITQRRRALRRREAPSDFDE